MTTIALLADPPRPELVLQDVVAETDLTHAEAADLYAAMFKDVCRAVETSGADLLVNYRDDDDLDVEGEQSAEASLRALTKQALDDPEDVRFEVQVGSTFAARAGNTVSHLLKNDQAKTVGVVTPEATLVGRQQIDSAAMKLRRNDVVLGPASGGRVYYAGFAEPIDFEDVYASPALNTLTDRSADADLEVDFLEMQPLVEGEADLVALLTQIRARQRAGWPIPRETADCLTDLGVTVVDGRLNADR
jgi:hypothetical protein